MHGRLVISVHRLAQGDQLVGLPLLAREDMALAVERRLDGENTKLGRQIAIQRHRRAAALDMTQHAGARLEAMGLSMSAATRLTPPSQAPSATTTI